ncbi:helix-loop-helix DNA-binding domain-containing protein [Xylogone sp. PMI_703]|nr:helix-loop-helix DNA-binding domain-containing protein [Xylogone sp. PMI_703]
MDSSAMWNGEDSAMPASSHDDFQQFLDMNLGESLNFEYHDFNSQQGQQLIHGDGGEQMDTAMGNDGMIPQKDTIMQDHMPPMTMATSHPTIPSSTMAHEHPATESLVELDAQIQYLQQQRHQQQQRQLQEQQRNFYAQNGIIPPTPNSMEMHGQNGQFYSQLDNQQQAMYERFRMQIKEQDLAFTPLVSPAVTPLDSQFNIPEYTVPGAYFSPLSSPALHAQNEHAAYDPRLTGNSTNSPVDINLGSHSAPSSSVIHSTKGGRNTTQKQRPTRSVRQSPIVKPRRKKAGSTATISAQALNDIMEPTNGNDMTKLPPSSAASTGSSENDSISPEHLSDMAPPPLPPPGSAGRSPYIAAQKENGRPRALTLGSPATPASLMRITKSPSVIQPSNPDADIDNDQAMGGFSLPEAVNSKRIALSRKDTQSSDGQTTPTLSSSGAKTPGLPPLPSPALQRPRTATSASQSPVIEDMNSAANRKTPQITSRSSKKRLSSSVLVSPALLPKISPSIKPLLPGGATLSEDTASYLASKSNYQNILEGTHLPGVSYPSELSTNLTSKRTSHKIAEQGRRNRINSALQEIATLLPRPGNKDSGGEKSGSGEAGEKDGENGSTKPAQSANSKASTVELAIEYIKQLQKEVAAATKRAEEAEKKLEEKECEVKKVEVAETSPKP